MQCLQCGQNNAAAVGFCGRCGSKMDFTADEISGALVKDAKEETAANTEYYAKQALIFTGALFLLALTLFILSLGSPTASHFMPGLSQGSRHTDVEVKVDPQLPHLAVPIEIRKR